MRIYENSKNQLIPIIELIRYNSTLKPKLASETKKYDFAELIFLIDETDKEKLEKFLKNESY
ncbi:hypothetical protein LEP1GSC186_1441 [Leptospira noguchii serovar Autumnalis str. ZUN142]|uniref:Uncharacterized protein n=1 Tax=Leptospira noguchii serovar Autumnalis str. ZUN142 TaxID=1085540 RepID=M6UAI2_9LEPT|nr:hypothetical protein [Leptospira noguchii]EMO39951.1 hypothetical protein LEP1GSC186_1441 [Leptospira noguchii serovar Autumnalis str. ZUN142]